MQAVFYALTGDPFCDDPCCRLFNAHWQREMLAAQLSRPDFCRRHEKMIAGEIEADHGAGLKTLQACPPARKLLGEERKGDKNVRPDND
jgi:hypothetical protein